MVASREGWGGTFPGEVDLDNAAFREGLARCKANKVADRRDLSAGQWKDL